MINLFTFKFNGLKVDQDLWNLGAGGPLNGQVQATWNTPSEVTGTGGGAAGGVVAGTSWDWQHDQDPPYDSFCWAKYGHNSFCKWGWARLLFVFSTFNLFSLAFTTFNAFSVYAGL